MKFGLNMLLYTAAFSKKAFPAMKKLARMGFDGVEIPLIDPCSVDAAGTKKALDACGLQVTTSAVVGEKSNLISDNATVRKAGVKCLKTAIKKTADMGGTLMCGPVYSPCGKLVGRPRTKQEWDRAVKALREAARYAQDFGVTIAVEPLNRFETYFLNTIGDAAQLAKDVGEKNLGIMVDTFHAHMEEKDTAAAIKKAGRLVKHVHACCNDRGVPGSGQIRWETIFPALKAIKYDGWMVIEAFSSALKEIAATAAIWRDIVPSQEKLGKDGLAFLRKNVAAK